MRTLKKILLVAFILVLLIGGFFIYIKVTPPLVTGTIFKGQDHHTVVIAIGNKGIGDLEITSVKVNNHADPNEIKIQVSNVLVGFAGTIDENSVAASHIQYFNIEDISIPKGTIPEELLKKFDEGSATEKDTIYGLTVNHHEDIHNVHIKYRYLGILFNETVVLD
ncbi:hypothetical protein [Ureibacillus sp. FSL K6-0786]|uniref:hypothetical protein n=1 Tax=Ureibacillus sp. FSL K6-0786 TaxID=2954607 RepID=UPI0030DB7126